MKFSLKASIKDGQHKVQSGTHPSEKQLVAELFRNDSVSDNDTPVLSKEGRPTEILPGVRVPWSGADRRLNPSPWYLGK